MIKKVIVILASLVAASNTNFLGDDAPSFIEVKDMFMLKYPGQLEYPVKGKLVTQEIVAFHIDSRFARIIFKEFFHQISPENPNRSRYLNDWVFHVYFKDYYIKICYTSLNEDGKQLLFKSKEFLLATLKLSLVDFESFVAKSPVGKIQGCPLSLSPQ